MVNGDHILYILAKQLKEQNELANNTVVTTVMSNLGLYRALELAGISSVQTNVGDRFIWENMKENGHTLGGEQSGHIIVSKFATTGDGILTAILLMEAMIEAKEPLSRLSSPVKMLPQVTVNVPVANKKRAKMHPSVQAALEQAKKELGSNGRILLRESGTEPVLRVMVEATAESICKTIAERVADEIRLHEKEQ